MNGESPSLPTSTLAPYPGNALNSPTHPTPVLNRLNSIEGKIDVGVSLLIYLTDFNAASINLTGGVGRGLFFLPQLARLNLANNRFNGTLLPDLG
jgi:hypothetical protein